MTSQAGGKGVNISRASVAAGVPSIAVLPAADDDPFVHELLARRHRLPAGPDRRRAAGQHHDHRARRHHHQAQQPRPDRRPPRSSPRSTDALRRRAGGADWVVLAGSLPPGAPVGWYAELVAALRGTGARIAVDTSDAPAAGAGRRSRRRPRRT